MSFKLGAITMLISFVAVFITGDITSRVMTEQQPMKMAAAEAAYDTKANAPFSLLTIGTLDGSKAVFQIGIPSMLSFLSTGNFNGVVEGVNDLEREYDLKYGPGDYTPNIPLAYWSFRLMIGFGFRGFGRIGLGDQCSGAGREHEQSKHREILHHGRHGRRTPARVTE